MTNLTCLNCGAAITNGLAMCDLCCHKATTDLEFIPVYYANLARWRPGRAGARPVPGSVALYDGSTPRGDRIITALDKTLTVLLMATMTLTQNRPAFPRPLTLADAILVADIPADLEEQLADDPGLHVAWLCYGLTQHLIGYATSLDAVGLVNKLAGLEHQLRRLTEQVIPGWYAGLCPCGHPTHVVPGLTWVTCQGCGLTTYARDHLHLILREARSWVARPVELAAAVVALTDTEASISKLSDRIRQWSSRKLIPAIRAIDDDGDEVGPKRYRLGDVLDRLHAEGATREDDVA